MSLEINFKAAGLSEAGIKTFDGQLIAFKVDLSALNGYNAGWFLLRVIAGGNAGQDWAVWVNPRIEGP